MSVCYTGELRRTDAALAPIRALPDPVVDLLQAQSYAQLQSYLDATEPRGLHYCWKTWYLADLHLPLLSALTMLFAAAPSTALDLGVLHLGGALNRHAANDGSVGNRDVRFVVGVKGMWDPGDPNAGRDRQWICAASEELRRFSTRATYFNFQGVDEAEHEVAATYGANYARLAGIKRKYDPQNPFRVNCNIRPG